MVMEDVFRDIIRDEVQALVKAVREEIRVARAERAATKLPDATVFLSVKQVATRLGIEPQTVRCYLKDGDLVGTKRRTTWTVRAEDLEAFLATKKERAPNSDEQLAKILRRVQTP